MAQLLKQIKCIFLYFIIVEAEMRSIRVFGASLLILSSQFFVTLMKETGRMVMDTIGVSLIEDILFLEQRTKDCANFLVMRIRLFRGMGFLYRRKKVRTIHLR